MLGCDVTTGAGLQGRVLLADRLPEVIRAIAATWNEEEPWLSWAGECGCFFHAVWERLKAEGIAVEGDSFDNGLNCDTALTDVPGISLDALKRSGATANLNHVWITANGKHYDAAHPDGVSCPLQLRVVRQALVESMRLCAPELAEQLCRDHAWWRESAELLEAFIEGMASAEAAQ